MRHMSNTLFRCCEYRLRTCDLVLNNAALGSALCALFTNNPDLMGTPVEAQITNIAQETPSVKRINLRVSSQRFAFRPGQWVDFHVPGLQQIGGFSITSTPRQLQEDGSVQLAVKLSSQAPVQWLHNEAKVDDWVAVRVGGTFSLEDTDVARPLLLVAGGIGITPIISILAHALDVTQEASQASGAERPCMNAKLLYSASSPEELAFQCELHQLRDRSQGGISLDLRSTTAAVEPAANGCSSRFSQQDLAQALHHLEQQQLDRLRGKTTAATGSDKALAFICGPPQMTDDMVTYFRQYGMDDSQMRYEKWW